MTKPYTTTNIAICPDTFYDNVYAEDLSFSSLDRPFPDAIALYLDGKHLRYFPTMQEFTEWLHAARVVVKGCVIVPAT